MIESLGIISARDLPISGGNANLPNMSGTIVGYFQRIILGLVQSVVVDHEVAESITQIQTSGVIQPFSSVQLRLKPEGERSWKWNLLHALPNTPITEGMYLYHAGVKFRVMSLKAYHDYGYTEFELVEGYVGGN